jgi:glucoamylase
MGWAQRPPSEIQMGNGTLLATFDGVGEIEQLFAPNIDALQSRLGGFQTLVLVPGDHSSGGQVSLIPLTHEHFNIQLQLITGSQVLQAEYRHKHRPIQLFRKIALHPTDPILLDQWKITGERAGLLHTSIPWMGNATSGHCSMYHPSFDGIVHHRGRRWLGAITRLGSTQWVRVGHLSETDRYRMWAGDKVSVPLHGGDFSNFPSEIGARQSWDQVAQGCSTWGAMGLGPSEDLEFLVVCAESERHLENLILKMKHLPSKRFMQLIEGMVERRYLPAAPYLKNILNPKVKSLCERSIDVLHALQDARKGALMAAAEVDPHSQLSGGYGYSWPRDGAYLASALGAFGFHDRVEHYFKFLTETQDTSGTWWQRYLATGHAGPSWGRIQIDEPATVLAAAYVHFQRTRNYLWLEGFWPTLQKGLSFLEKFHSNENRMGSPSHDLWEERMGIHAYSLGAVAAAFTAGAYLAGELMETEAQAKYQELGKQISSIIFDRFTPSEGPIFRSYIIQGGGENYWDQTVDVSMLGLIRPFGIIHEHHPVAQKIIEQIRAQLWHSPTGGIMRYVGDYYRGGNPWILTTLWLASVELSLGNYDGARNAFQWSISKSTSLGMLPEQIDKVSGNPSWVIPLAWSHAMFLNFVREVQELKVENKIWD